MEGVESALADFRDFSRNTLPGDTEDGGFFSSARKMR
jgi:hypothetical protein